VAKLKLSPFVTTLGTLSIVRGLAYVATHGRVAAPAVALTSELFMLVTSGRLFDTVPVIASSIWC
jgi:ribose transport system permease protein